MLIRKLKISTSIILLAAVAGLSGCSTLDKMSQSVGNLTGLGGKTADSAADTLVVPPTLKLPISDSNQAVATSQPQPAQQAERRVLQSSANYYIIVGTYPDQLDALNTFTRLSSIGLKGVTMESRRSKSDDLLHMVRLGPYYTLEDIDKAKDSLTNTGLSQFKVVKN